MLINHCLFLLALTIAAVHAYIEKYHEKKEDRLMDVLEDFLTEYITDVEEVSKDSKWQVNDDASEWATWDSNDCVWRGKGHGEENECDWSEVAVGACQSGMKKDCKVGKKSFSSRLKCCKTGKVGTKSFPLKNVCYGWFPKNAGKYVECPTRQFVGGLCGSGAHKDCKKWTSTTKYTKYHHKIRCCAGFDFTVFTGSEYCDWFYTKAWGYPLECKPNYILAGECGSGRYADCETQLGGGFYTQATHWIKCCPFKYTP